MQLILTHEQSDFDAVASLLGAHLLDPSAQPVLSRRLNRNVRSFVTLYGAELPFVDPRDLPSGAVQSVLLVDTQSLITLKGMGEKTKVRIIDHHPMRQGLPDEWDVTIVETGATTTTLVESIQKRGDMLTMIQATLLLLGIYEDTGSLTYAGTTPRDARAAAHLLEQGADLRLAADFLNPPLSPEQHQVYEQLVANAQTHYIHGHRIVIACGDAGGMEEEISTLAHKLRDLFDPDAVFVLVATAEGVRLVARSTTDQVDVSVIARHFKGGGHDRAAAALVKDASPITETGARSAALAETCQELLEILPRHVQPSVTVSQIMSPHPRTLTPETSVQKAAQLMQQYGYEGYPVVQENKVLGLLTRRAVDRAINHKLNLTAASLMEAGEVTVTPDDSLQHLQSCMTDSGWGQVPVVDPKTGEVIGIVTRTDLLKTLSPRRVSTSPRNLARQLEKALPAERLALIRAISAEAAEKNVALYIVGGFVRDLLLERPSLDFDMVVEGDAIQLAKAIAKKFGGRVTGHARFGTAKWFLAGSSIAGENLPPFLDFISARIEFYAQPTALPTVERGSIKLDLHRRDFTINTLALRLDGHHYGSLLDYWGGLDDLEQGLVRVLHSLSFVDDPTRMLRAVRFEQRFGFQIETRSLQLMAEALPLLERLSSERVGHEIDLILDEPKAADMFNRLHDLKLLQGIHPALGWDKNCRVLFETGLEEQPPAAWRNIPDLRQVPRRRALGYLLWLSFLPAEKIRQVSSRLRLAATLRKALLETSALRKDLPALVDARPSTVYARLEDIHPLVLFASWIRADGPEQEVLASYLSCWRHVAPKTDGHTLKELGLSPGPVYKEILHRIRDAWLDGEIETEKEEEQLLGKLMKELQE